MNASEHATVARPQHAGNASGPVRVLALTMLAIIIGFGGGRAASICAGRTDRTWIARSEGAVKALTTLAWPTRRQQSREWREICFAIGLSSRVLATALPRTCSLLTIGYATVIRTVCFLSLGCC